MTVGNTSENSAFTPDNLLISSTCCEDVKQTPKTIAILCDETDLAVTDSIRHLGLTYTGRHNSDQVTSGLQGCPTQADTILTKLHQVHKHTNQSRPDVANFTINRLSFY